MEKTPSGHQKMLQDIERLIAEAPDEASRRDLERLRDSLNSPQMLEMAREAMSKPRASGTLVLDFHDPLLPSVVTAAGGVISAAFCLYAVMLGLERPRAQRLASNAANARTTTAPPTRAAFLSGRGDAIRARSSARARAVR